jgi:hypothetical protein
MERQDYTHKVQIQLDDEGRATFQTVEFRPSYNLKQLRDHQDFDEV